MGAMEDTLRRTAPVKARILRERPAGSTSAKRHRFWEEGRTLHLVDIENLMGGPLGGDELLRNVSRAYRSSARMAVGDHAIVACNPTLLLPTKLEWEANRVLVGFGPDGADRRLLAELTSHRWVVSHFDRVVIGSGDGIFSRRASILRHHGVRVEVVALRGAIARRLQRAVDQVHCLNLTEVAA